VITEFPAGSVDDVDNAYRAAAAAQPGWAALVPAAKRRVFEVAAAYLEDNADKIVALLTREAGATQTKARFEVWLTSEVLKESAGIPSSLAGSILPSATDGKMNLLYRDPVGTVCVIAPFNLPLFLAVKAVAPALACGNAVVLKPHEDVPLVGGVLIGEMFEAAGLPPGVLNMINTDIRVVGDVFVVHDVPRVVAFTGSAAVGGRVAELAGRTFKQVVLELGGNNAMIVCDDADLQLAVDVAANGRVLNAGQACIAPNRLLVHRDLFDQFTQRLAHRLTELQVGDPSDPATQIGPLINTRQVAALTAVLDRSLAQGARPLLQGMVSGPNDTLVSPTLLGEVQTDMACMQEEMFGPIAAVMPFDTDEEAITIANNSRYGLTAVVHTPDLGRALSIARNLQVGMVHINDWPIHDEAHVPFGGVRQSGLGALNGLASIEAFTTLQLVSPHLGRPQLPL
jgi:acyl-CoA reductase-like NAD-dependent aldehyde dehydrogenase